MLRNGRIHRSEKPGYTQETLSNWRVYPAHCNLRKLVPSKKDPVQPKRKKEAKKEKATIAKRVKFKVLNAKGTSFFLSEKPKVTKA